MKEEVGYRLSIWRKRWQAEGKDDVETISEAVGIWKK